MSQIVWIGNTAITTVQQVDTLTPATIEVGDTFSGTITGEDGTTAAISFVATGTTAANVSAGFIAAWNASTHRLITPITASGSSTVVLTADSAGVPFSIATSTADGGGANTQTFTRAATTANVGPSDAGLAQNYYNNAVPASSGDTLTIDGRSSAAISYGLNLSAKTLDVLNVTMANAYTIGSTVGYFRIGATVANIGLPAADGSSPSGPALIAIDTGSATTTFNVYNSNRTGTNSLPTVNWKGSDASNIVNVFGGVFGAATLLPGDTATIATFNQTGGTATLASGVTLTTAKQNDGTLYLKCAATTVTNDGGSIQTTGSGAITTLNVSGTADLQSTGTITTLNIRTGGTVTFANSNVARTVTTIKMYSGSTLDLDCGSVAITVTNPIELINCALADVTIRTPKHVKVAVTAGS